MDGVLDVGRPKGLVVVAILLWITTSVLSVVLIPTVLDLVTRVYVAFWADYSGDGQTYWGGVAIRQFAVLPLAVLSVGVAIGGAEFHMRHFGTPKSWWVYTHTLGIELGVLLMAAIV